MKSNDEDFGEFDALVESYDGYTFWFELGYHATFRFWRIFPPSRSAVHPYRYELVLHEPSGVRIMGFDNAHPIHWKSGKFTQRSRQADHWHRDRSDQGRPYEFVSISQLLEDFFQQVEVSLGNINVSPSMIEVTSTRSRDDE
jgi:hypothetical protein